ncbi:uncharacterized protein SOCE26_049260 [Sorangium cellulosum]|uniref:Uncharacterized protein n=1 Tax=Sorangium cellulosum TaxID=56 RepID=A0A2L0EVZ4_SORCE|nr:hypothetical protein [Sorangium cellulosum]AUX43477.1 uncharacterized protein SOCE26_049260 [Sorangium cellulosum]
MTFKGPHDTTNLGTVPKVAQVFWSRKRCYHGEEVQLSVRTENVPDNAAVELRISTRDGGIAIDTITGVAIKASKLDHKVAIDLKDKGLPAGTGELVFQAAVGKLVSGPSPVLLVDLAPPAFVV